MFTVQFASRMNEDIKRVAAVNRGLTELQAGDLAPDVYARLRKAAGVQEGVRRVTLHRYHPREDLGGGILGWLAFDHDRIARLIDRGFRDAVEHDCYRSECVMLDGTTLAPNQ